MLSANIKKLRIKKSLSQDRLSKLSDLSLNTIVKVESGRNPNPTIKTLLKIARGLEVKVDDLLLVALVAVMSACWCGLCLAAEPAPPTATPSSGETVITISEGIRILLKDSRLIKGALFEDEMALQDALMSRSALLPHVNANASQTFLKFQPAAKVGLSVANTAQRSSFAYGFDVYQTLFDFGRSLFNYKASREAAKAQIARTESIRRIVTLEFIVVYFDVLEAAKMVGVLEKEVESLSAYLSDIEHLYEQGVVVKNDVLPAKVRLANVKQQLIEARNTRDMATARLTNILALPIDQPIAVRDITMKPQEFVGMQKAWETAVRQRPEVAFYDDQIRAAGFSERSKAAGNLPVIFADAGYTNAQNEYQVHQDNFSAGLGAKVDLYDGGLARADLLKQRALRGQLFERKQKLVDDIKLEVEDSYFSLKNSSEKVVVAEDTLAEAQENVRFYRAKYNAGSATPTEVLEAIAQETAAQTNALNSDYEMKRSYTKLMYSMGIDLAMIYEIMETRQNGHTNPKPKEE